LGISGNDLVAGAVKTQSRAEGYVYI